MNTNIENVNNATEETKEKIITCNCCGAIIEFRNYEADLNTLFTEEKDDDGDIIYYCRDCVEAGRVDNYTICDECNHIVLEDDCCTIDDEGDYCGACISYKETNNLIKECDDCGGYYTIEEMCCDDEGTALCEDCYDRGFYNRCEDCGRIITENEGYCVNYDTSHELIVCGNCLGDYCRCDDCGRYWDDDYIHSDDYGNHVCDACYEHRNYERCRNCDTILPEDYQYWDDDGNCYCEDCYHNAEEAAIHNYSYKPSPEFFNVMEDNDTEEYFGVELEVDRGDDPNSTAKEVTDIMDFNGWEHLYCKRDGSLGDDTSFEMVSHPCTLRYHMYEMPWEEVMETCVQSGFRSHDTTTCGLHIHVSRAAFGETPDEQDLTIAKTIMLFDKFWDKAVKFSRRTSAQIRWTQPCNIDITDNDKFVDIIDKVKKTKNKGRYQVVNLTNTDTVEFRLFRGTLKYNTFIAALQFVATITRYAKQLALIDIWRVTWDDIFYNTEYEELKTYLKERNLYGTSLTNTNNTNNDNI